MYKAQQIALGLFGFLATGARGAEAFGSQMGLRGQAMLSDGRRLLAGESGAMATGIGPAVGLLVGGIVLITIGLILSGIIRDQAATSGSAANVGSFSGFRALNDLVPLVVIAAIVLIGVGLMAIGGLNLYKMSSGGKGK